MKKYERFIYDLVKGNPQVKNFIRNWYQRIFDAFPKSPDLIKDIVYSKNHAFFGFHDVHQISHDDRKVLFNRAMFDLRMPGPEDQLQIWCADLTTGHEEIVGVSNTWNWHMGCRSQWVAEEGLVAFNTSTEEVGLILKRFDGDVEQHFKYHASCFSDAGDFYVGHDFYHVEYGMPGYGYTNSRMGANNHVVSKSVYRVNVADGEPAWSVSVHDVEKHLGRCASASWFGFLTHTSISKNGDCVAFLYRQSDVQGDILRRETRLVFVDSDGGNFRVAATGNMVSHYCWLNDAEVLAYCRTLEGNDAYCVICAESGAIIRELGYDVLASDGHPSVSSDGSVAVTDTYPDRRRKSRLLVGNQELNQFRLLAEVSSAKQYQSPDPLHHWACDLHPRVSRSGEYVSFDSTHSGARATYVLSLNSGVDPQEF